MAGSQSTFVIEAQSGETVDGLDRETIRSLFKQHGCLHLKGFAATDAQFRAFTEQYAKRFVIDLGTGKAFDSRPFDQNAAFVQKLAPSKKEQELHQENGRWSDYPDLLWFHCVRPATSGGESKIADGAKVWKRLSQSTTCTAAWRSRTRSACTTPSWPSRTSRAGVSGDMIETRAVV